MIASQSDLGSVTALWRQPELYARFLDQELSLAYRGPVLIVMPNGVGLASAAPLSARGAVGDVTASSRTDRSNPTHSHRAERNGKARHAAGHTLPADVMTSTATPSAVNALTGTIAYLVLALAPY